MVCHVEVVLLHILTRWFGVFLVDEGKVLEKKLFPKEPEEIAKRIMSIRQGEILPEEEEIVGGREVKTTERRQSGLGNYEQFSFDLNAMEYGFSSGSLHTAMLLVAEEGLGAPGRDRMLIQAVGAMEELNKTANLLSERLVEWYGLHSHDLARSVSAKKLAELVFAFGTAEEIRSNTDLDPGMTAKMEPMDMASIRSLAHLLEDVFKERDKKEKYIHVLMGELAPNTSAVAGPVLGARLIAHAGGLEKLANMPASTVQVLGAETALFLHLKEGKKPPKHGLIFQHTLVHNSPHWQRGKISRSLAAKISLAARVDQASGRDISKDLLERLDKRMEEIRRRYPNPPAKSRKTGEKGRGRGKGKEDRNEGGGKGRPGKKGRGG